MQRKFYGPFSPKPYLKESSAFKGSPKKRQKERNEYLSCAYTRAKGRAKSCPRQETTSRIMLDQGRGSCRQRQGEGRHAPGAWRREPAQDTGGNCGVDRGARIPRVMALDPLHGRVGE